MLVQVPERQYEDVPQSCRSRVRAADLAFVSQAHSEHVTPYCSAVRLICAETRTRSRWT